MPAGTGEQRHLRRFTILYIKKQSVHYRILRSYKDTLHGRNGIIGFREIMKNKNGIRVVGNQYFYKTQMLNKSNLYGFFISVFIFLYAIQNFMCIKVGKA